MKKNFLLKIASFLLAVLMWLFVISRGQSTLTLESPVEFINMPKGIELAETKAHMAAVSIKGHEKFFKNLGPGDIRIRVDVRASRAGERQFTIDEGSVRLPFFLRLAGITPSFIKVRFEKTVGKTVPVKAALKGSAKKGFSIRSVEVAPNEVLVEGAESKVRNLMALDTEPLDITDADSAIIKGVKIIPDKGIRPEVDIVTVKVVIRPIAGRPVADGGR